jgi:hypothetical protein
VKTGVFGKSTSHCGRSSVVMLCAPENSTRLDRKIASVASVVMIEGTPA